LHLDFVIVLADGNYRLLAIHVFRSGPSNPVLAAHRASLYTNLITLAVGLTEKTQRRQETQRGRDAANGIQYWPITRLARLKSDAKGRIDTLS
jgi:hypothetical protein